MGAYYNPGNGNFESDLSSRIFIDKSLIISKLNEVIGTNEKFICISRPRRFGKSMTANMITAYYSKGCDSTGLFKNLKISSEPSFEENLNRYDLIRMDFAAVDGMTSDKDKIVSEAQRLVCEELQLAFPDVVPSISGSIAGFILAIIQKHPEQKFIIIIDEYDLIFRNYEHNIKLQNQYLDFLNSLFKNGDIKANISLAYLTGILPIIREKAQSKLNEFRNVSMLNPNQFASFIGFTEDEVSGLCDKYNMDFAEIKKWYNGYRFRGQINAYCPQSVVFAITNQCLDDYWVQTSSAETLFTYIDCDYEGLQEDVEHLIAGERVAVEVSYFDNTLTAINCKDDVLTYFIHLGYLAYDIDEKECYIPNYEIQQEWVKTVKRSKRYSYVANYINNSKKLLQETWNGNEEYVANALDKAHTDNTSILQYNDENSLSAVVTYAYMLANAYYMVIREMPTGKGFADIVYLPVGNNKPAMVVELKFNHSANTALDQIKNKNYPEVLQQYTGEILLVGINYDKATKKHECKIENISK